MSFINITKYISRSHIKISIKMIKNVEKNILLIVVSKDRWNQIKKQSSTVLSKLKKSLGNNEIIALLLLIECDVNYNGSYHDVINTLNNFRTKHKTIENIEKYRCKYYDIAIENCAWK